MPVDVCISFSCIWLSKAKGAQHAKGCPPSGCRRALWQLTPNEFLGVCCGRPGGPLFVYHNAIRKCIVRSVMFLLLLLLSAQRSSTALVWLVQWPCKCVALTHSFRCVVCLFCPWPQPSCRLCLHPFVYIALIGNSGKFNLLMMPASLSPSLKWAF
jgi:hypothetical protein